MAFLVAPGAANPAASPAARLCRRRAAARKPRTCPVAPAQAPEHSNESEADADQEQQPQTAYYADLPPGKIVLTPEELAEQRVALSEMAERLKRERLQREYEESRLLGWTPAAEIINGRVAMFFFLTGVLTEYWTGQSIGQQITTMAETLGLL